MNRMSFIEKSAPDLYSFKDCLPSFVKMVALYAEMGVAYLELNKAKKKYMCVYCHMSKKSRVGRSALIFFFNYWQNWK